MKNSMLWFGFFVCVLVGVIQEGVHISALIQPTAGLIVYGPLLSYLIYRCGGDLFGFMKRVITGDISDEDTLTIERVCSLGLMFGGVSLVVGLIHTMGNLSDPSRLGGGVAVAFLSVVYAAVPSILLLPVTKR